MNTPIRVLIVDDEERFRETAATILRKRGFEIMAVGSGFEAIGEIQIHDIDVVVLDIKMPGMDGNETFREIKKIKPEIEVLMLTGHGTPESAMDGLREGVFDYLLKPCSIDLLAQKIREAHTRETGLTEKEARVKNIMLPLSSFSSIPEDKTVADAVDVILAGLTHTLTTSTVQESVHRSILVLDKDGRVNGIISFTDLLHGLQPHYMRLLTEKPTMADSIHLESPNYSGMFTIMTRDLANMAVREVICDTPPIIDADANLMEAATQLLSLNLRRLLVEENDNIVGVIREQDLFFEMTNTIRQHNG